MRLGMVRWSEVYLHRINRMLLDSFNDVEGWYNETSRLYDNAQADRLVEQFSKDCMRARTKFALLEEHAYEIRIRMKEIIESQKTE